MQVERPARLWRVGTAIIFLSLESVQHTCLSVCVTKFALATLVRFKAIT